MFKISARGNGFHVTFANGYTASVQFSDGHYCTHDDNGHATSAEVAIIRPDGALQHREDWADGSVNGWQSPEEVAAFLVQVSNL